MQAKVQRTEWRHLGAQIRLVGTAVFWGLGAVVHAAEDTTANGMTLRELWQAGGPLMYVLAALSIVGLALVIYLIASLRVRAVVPRRFVEEVTGALHEGRLDEAQRLCREGRCVFAAVAGTAVEALARMPDVRPEALKELVETEGNRQAGHLQSRVQHLQDIAVVAPMVGLLGTVMGMLQAFQAVAYDIVRARPIELARGVSQALITTAAGLIVGIPAMIAHAWFRGRLADLTARMESAASELVQHLPPRRGGR